MAGENEPSPSITRFFAVSLFVAILGTGLLVGGRFFEFGLEKVLGDIWVYVGLFVFLIVVTMGALLLSARLGNRKK